MNDERGRPMTYWGGMQGRTPEHQARNEQCCEIIVDLIIVTVCGGAIGYLTALIFGLL